MVKDKSFEMLSTLAKNEKDLLQEIQKWRFALLVHFGRDSLGQDSK